MIGRPPSKVAIPGTWTRPGTRVAAISVELGKLLSVRGKMTSHNNFCIEVGDIALLRADHRIADAAGTTILAGSSAEVVRRQPDGTWLYVIDHAMGATLPRVDAG